MHLLESFFFPSLFSISSVILCRNRPSSDHRRVRYRPSRHRFFILQPRAIVFFLTKRSRYPTIVYTLAHDRWYMYICRNACCCAGGGPCFHPRYRATLATWRSQREEIGRRYRMAHRVYIRRMEKTVRLVVRRLSWLYTVSQTRELDILGKDAALVCYCERRRPKR